MNEVKNLHIILETPEAAYPLAADIDQFLEDYDTYEYRDDVEDKEENIQNIAHDIYEGKTDYLKKGLQECIDDNRDPEQTKTAESILRELNLIRCKN
ncbi:MAG: hypothetical protein ABF497_08140 [Sporolactobacillus sp.]